MNRVEKLMSVMQSFGKGSYQISTIALKVVRKGGIL